MASANKNKKSSVSITLRAARQNYLAKINNLVTRYSCPHTKERSRYFCLLRCLFLKALAILMKLILKMVIVMETDRWQAHIQTDIPGACERFWARPANGRDKTILVELTGEICLVEYFKGRLTNLTRNHLRLLHYFHRT